MSVSEFLSWRISLNKRPEREVLSTNRRTIKKDVTSSFTMSSYLSNYHGGASGLAIADDAVARGAHGAGMGEGIDIWGDSDPAKFLPGGELYLYDEYIH